MQGPKVLASDDRDVDDDGDDDDGDDYDGDDNDAGDDVFTLAANIP